MKAFEVTSISRKPILLKKKSVESRIFHIMEDAERAASIISSGYAIAYESEPVIKEIDVFFILIRKDDHKSYWIDENNKAEILDDATSYESLDLAEEALKNVGKFLLNNEIAIII